MAEKAVKRALISVTDKAGIVNLVQGLRELGYVLVCTSGTGKVLRDKGIPYTKVEDLPDCLPEMLGGRVKTLQLQIHAALLAKQDDPNQMAELEKYGILPFQIAIVNFYPWERKIAEIGLPIIQIIEDGMDIGGPTMVCSAIKNYLHVVVVIDPNDYSLILEEIKEKGDIREQTRLFLAAKASFEVAWYRSRIYQWMAKTFGIKTELFPNRVLLGLEKVMDLRYGENPHQKAAFYREVGFNQPAITTAKFLQGQTPSATTITDLNAALETVREFSNRKGDIPEYAAVAIKHGTICGPYADVGNASRVEIFEKAWDVDSMSAFGGVLGFNFALDIETANAIVKNTVHGIVACGFENGVLDIFKKRKKMPVFEVGQLKELSSQTMIYKPVTGGFVCQEANSQPIDYKKWTIMVGEEPAQEQWNWIVDGWKVLKHIKSNAICILDKDGNVVGVGGGHVNRVGAAEIALKLAGEKAKDGILLSDALIPFPDLVELAAKFGIKIIVQTGGSIKDEEVTKAAKEHGITMIHTHRRAFWH